MLPQQHELKKKDTNSGLKKEEVQMEVVGEWLLLKKRDFRRVQLHNATCYSTPAKDSEKDKNSNKATVHHPLVTAVCNLIQGISNIFMPCMGVNMCVCVCVYIYIMAVS